MTRTTDPTAVALRQAVDADITDDLPRLALADYLEEAGDLKGAGHVRNGVRMPLTRWLDIGPALCRKYPIRTLVVTGKKPDGGHGECQWMRWRHGVPCLEYHLPPCLFDLLSAALLLHRNTAWRQYHRRRFAFADLNRAALLWAQTEAAISPSSP